MKSAQRSFPPSYGCGARLPRIIWDNTFRSAMGRSFQRIQAYGAATARAGDPTAAATRGAAVLNNVVHGTAITQGIIDAFVVIAAATALTVIFIVTRRAAPPGPASHMPVFAPRQGAPQ